MISNPKGRRYRALVAIALLWPLSASAGQLAPTSAPACPTEPGAAANVQAREIVEKFRARFDRDVRVPEWCFASTEDYDEIAQRLLAVCNERPGDADAEATALVALKAGRCAGFEAGRRSMLGAGRRGTGERFGVESGGYHDPERQ